MIENPPLLKIQSRQLEVSQELINELSAFPTGFIVDAMHGRGALPSCITPLTGADLPVDCCGRILTVDAGPGDVLATLASLSEVQENDVLVIATGGYDGCAAIGDRVIGMARNCGAQAVVTDGLVRDVKGIEKVGLPVFCSGVSPNSPYNSGPGSIGMTIVIGDVQISRDDVLLADADGAVVVPGRQMEQVVAACHHIATIESELDAEVDNGLKVPDSIKELLQSEQVVRL